jgi:hypothetical protein
VGGKPTAENAGGATAKTGGQIGERGGPAARTGEQDLAELVQTTLERSAASAQSCAAESTQEKKKGGRPRHAGKGRKLKPPDQVSQVVSSLPSVCRDCGRVLHGVDPRPERHQVSELPKIEPEIIEYQRHTLTCAMCGTKNRAEWPADMPRGSFGERLQAMIGYLSGRFGISHRDMDELIRCDARYVGRISNAIFRLWWIAAFCGANAVLAPKAKPGVCSLSAY